VTKALQRFDEEFDRARRRAGRVQADGRTAKSARYDARAERVVIELNSGVAVAIPVRSIQGLARATDAARRDLKISGGGIGLHWPRIDLDINVRNVLAGVFGNREWMSELARHAGSRTSPAKASASRENGKKGGRPRKSVEQSRP
jgi:hypothetical protein